MNREFNKATRVDSGAAPAVHDLRARVPMMADDMLVSLRFNALRLKDSGSAIQRNSAADLLPVVEAEIADRKEKKKASMPPKAPRVSKKKVAVKAKKEDDDGEEAGAGDE